MSSAVSRSRPGRPQSPSCYMLPYGYQIDLDFIKYCENLTQPDPTDAELQRRQRRRQRQSMEVMLGIQLEMQQQMDQLNDFWERKPPEPPPRTHIHQIESPIVPYYAKQRKYEAGTKWDPSLHDVVDDFEKTLERSKKGKEKENRREKAKVSDEAAGKWSVGTETDDTERRTVNFSLSATILLFFIDILSRWHRHQFSNTHAPIGHQLWNESRKRVSTN